MGEHVARFVLGGLLVATFAVLGDLFKPKSFAGVFAAAPSVALATLALTVGLTGAGYAAHEARSMIVGALAFVAYASAVASILRRRGGRPRLVAALCAVVWIACAAVGWVLWLRPA
jgi:hypothetical protein